MGRSRRRYEDIDELVAREAGRSPRGGGTAFAFVERAALVAVVLAIAYVVLRALGLPVAFV
ncbi:MAG: hypothetical protein M3Q49_01620 [Actinomycetota bacterium]|nr:hypothetical protein [Actinomycetota bacterium]